MSGINYSRSQMYAYFSLYAYEDQDFFATNPLVNHLNNYELFGAISDSDLATQKLQNKIDILDESIYYRSSDGTQCNIYIDKITKEIMVSFTGTETTQDIIADTKSGIQQWYDNAEIVSNLIKKAKAEIGGEDITVNFTGHSLGGGLAQMAAYDYVVENGPNSKINLETFNSLGASFAMQEIIESRKNIDPTVSDYNENIFNTLTNSPIINHYRETADMVSPLFEHIGGQLNILSDGIERGGDAHSMLTLTGMFDSLAAGENIVSIEQYKIPLQENENFKYWGLDNLTKAALENNLSFRIGDITNFNNDTGISIKNLVETLGNILYSINKSDNVLGALEEIYNILDFAIDNYGGLFMSKIKEEIIKLEPVILYGALLTSPIWSPLIVTSGVFENALSIEAISLTIVYNSLFNNQNISEQVENKIQGYHDLI